MTSHTLPPLSQSADFRSCFLVVPLPLPLLLLGLHPLVLRGELWLPVARLHRSIHTLQHTQDRYVYVAGYDKKAVFLFKSVWKRPAVGSVWNSWTGRSWRFKVLVQNLKSMAKAGPLACQPVRAHPRDQLRTTGKHKANETGQHASYLTSTVLAAVHEAANKQCDLGETTANTDPSVWWVYSGESVTLTLAWPNLSSMELCSERLFLTFQLHGSRVTTSVTTL